MYPAGVPGVRVRYVTLDDGLSIRVLESGPPGNEAVLLVHGWGASVYTFAETLPALAENGHRAIAMDLPGHGLSEKPVDEARYTTSALCDAILGVAHSMGIRRFSFVGHSLGGSLGLELALRGDKRLQRLALISAVGLGRQPLLGPVKLLTPRVASWIVPRLLTRGAVALVLRLAFATAGRPTDRDIDEYWAPTQFDELVWACRACLHRVTWRPVPEGALRSLQLPVLVLAGGRDRLVLGAAKRGKLIPTARVVTIPEGGHVLPQECAARTNEELLRFLAGSEKGL
jgi:pimeloyl-ACP methyl ester carboxylesterase